MAPYIRKTTGKSMEDIASLLAENVAKMQGTPDVTDSGNNVPRAAPTSSGSGSDGTEDRAESETDDTGLGADAVHGPELLDSAGGVEDGDGVDSQSSTDTGGAADTSETGDGSEDSTSETNDATDEHSDSGGGEDDTPTFELSDDTLLDIGDGVEMTVADLIALHDADNSIATRLQEAEATRQEANALRAQVANEQNSGMQALAFVFQQMVAADEANPLPLPDEALKVSNPQLYIQQLDAYNAATAEVHQRRSAIEGALKQFNLQKQEQDEARRKQELLNLHRLVPAVGNPQTRAEAVRDIMDSARYYGFTDAELKGVIDAREMQMAHDAAQYRKLIANSGKNVEELITNQTVKTAARTKVLRSQNTTAQTQSSATAKAVKVTRAQAQKTGKPADVAAFMAAQRSARGA